MEEGMIQEAIPVVVAAVLPSREDQARLRDIFGHSRWTLHVAETLREGRHVIKDAGAGVVIAAHRLPDGSWRDILREMEPRPASLIVAARLADERLWAEVLGWGGFDLLSTPFDRREVCRAVSLAWRYWRDLQLRRLAPVAAHEASAGWRERALGAH
jgi:DNA-binding response OmpR family regulator